MATKTKKFLLVTPSESDFLDIIRDFVGKIARSAGFSDDYVSKIQLSVDEACTNVIRHAYLGMKQKDIEIRVELNAKKLVVSVVDRGRGFKPESKHVDDMEAYLSEYRKGGLGLHLIKLLMDEVQFSIHPNKMNIITLVKYLDDKQTLGTKRNRKSILEKPHARKR